MRHLKVQPEFRRGAEIARQPQGGVGGDPAPFVDDFPDAGRRHAQSQGQRMGREIERDEELFAQNLAGVGLDPHGALLGVGRSVVIDDFDLVRAAIGPDEDDAPLVVDPNAVLSGALPFSTPSWFSGKELTAITAFHL